MELLHEVINWIVSIIGHMGYIGIFIGMFLESSFFPFPSEIIMTPAGYLAFKGDMNLYIVIITGILGSLSGAWFNYILASRFGRKFLSKFISENKIKKLDDFFDKHGHISTFTGRLIPGIRQYISFPAGLSKMSALKFSIYTGLGAGIWVIVLTLLGYILGKNQDLINQYLKQITIITLILIFVLIFIYYILYKKKNTK